MTPFDAVKLWLLMVLIEGGASETLEQKMGNDSEISQFYAMLEKCTVCNISLQYESMTIFAPVNAAFQKLVGDDKDQVDVVSLVEYHMANVPKKTDQLGTSSINSKVQGSLPLWVTHSHDVSHNDIYINNAKIFVSESDKVFRAKGNGNHQLTHILHKIDEVLIPTIPKTQEPDVSNPTAWEFLKNYEHFIQNPHRIRNFKQLVEKFGKQDVFQTEGGHTFFIPVDEGFSSERMTLTDKHVIDGHVIPREILFTTPTRKDFPYPTLANSDNDLRVVVYFTQEKIGEEINNFVKSHTLFSSGKHRRGVVLAKILKANIPVKNGVIHLIHKPLIIVDTSVKDLLLEKDGKAILGNFVDAILDAGPAGERFLRTLEQAHELTLFAPCNKALEGDVMLNTIIRDKSRFAEVLAMHLVVDQSIYVDTVAEGSRNGVYQAPTENKFKNLYFNVGPNKTLTVEGGGVNATVIQQDIAAKNGIIHIIDRVLGVPYSNVLDKLKSDRLLTDSYRLGNMQYFNSRLNSTDQRFTYFVPRNKAWEDARIKMPSAIKKLFMPDYAYHATAILERHLVIADVAYTMQRIKQLSDDTSPRYDKSMSKEVELPSVRDKLVLYVEERPENTFTIYWKGIRIPVFRPNVECTNGVIHIIDVPFLLEGDITVNGALKVVLSPLIFIFLGMLFVFK